MSGTQEALARKLDFGDLPTAVTVTGRGRAALRLASGSGGLSGPAKYAVFQHRRRQAQIRARHVLDAQGSGPQPAPTGRDGREPAMQSEQAMQEVR